MGYFNTTEKRIDKMLSNFENLTTKENFDILQEYHLDLATEGFSTSTLRSRFQALHLLLKSNKDFQDLTPMDIKQVLRDIETMGIVDSTKNTYKVSIRLFLKYLKREDLADLIVIKKRQRNHKIPEDLLTKEEIEAMIDAASNPRDKAFIAALWEAGARIGELTQMLYKHVTYDEHGAILIFQKSKTGARRVRVVFSSAYLRQWMTSHPTKNPNDPLWPRMDSTLLPIIYETARSLIQRAAKNAGIKKKVHPHLFRHTRATELASHLSEQQMKCYLGWTPGSSMAATYVHLAGKDVDNAILKMSGVEVEEITVGDSLRVGKCPRCHQLNPEEAKYCFTCGMPLTSEQAKSTESTVSELIELLKQNPEALIEALGKVNKS